MLSHKNKNQSFVFEEEIDHSQNRASLGQSNRRLSVNHENQIDTLEGNRYIHDSGKIVLKVGGEEFMLETENTQEFFKYLKSIQSIWDPKNKIYCLPKWINKKYFEIFLNLLLVSSSSSQNKKFDLETSKNIIDISVFFKAYKLVKGLLNQSIYPNIGKTTCLKIIKSYLNYLYDEEETRILFVDVIQRSIDTAANNIFFLINNMHDELFSISEDSLEEIIEKYFESVMFNTSIDHSHIMRLMMKNRKLVDIYDLLENERKRSVSIFEKIHNEGIEPSIIWKIQHADPTRGYYKESEEFRFGNLDIVLINYYDAEKDIYNLALKLAGFKDLNKISIDKENSHSIISILSICEINEIKFKSKINFNCIFSNTKTKVLVCKIENFSNYFTNAGLSFNNLDYSLLVYFSISYNFSSILTHICKNFYEYHSLNSIFRISRNVLNIILKNEFLNVRSEDEVVYSVMNWINNRNNVTSDTILEILKNINWSSVTLDGLLDFIISQSKYLINSTELQGIIINEFSRRFREEYNTPNGGGMEQIENKIFNIPRKRYENSNKILHNLHSNINLISHGDTHNNNSLDNGNNSSFTSELILKLMKIPSRYETPYSQKSISHSNVSNKSEMNQSNSINPFKSNTDKIATNSSRNIHFQGDDSKNPSLSHVMNTSPDGSYHKIRKSSMTPPNEHEPFDNIKKINSSSVGISNSQILNASNLTKISAVPFLNKKFGSSSFKISENNNMKKKIFQCNLLVHKDEKYDSTKLFKMNSNQISNILSATSSRQKTPNKRTLNRDNSSHILTFKTKSKSPSLNERHINKNTVSQERSNFQNSLKKSIHTSNTLISNFKFSPIFYKKHKTQNLNINSNPGSNSSTLNCSNNGASVGIKVKTPKNISVINKLNDLILSRTIEKGSDINVKNKKSSNTISNVVIGINNSSNIDLSTNRNSDNKSSKYFTNTIQLKKKESNRPKSAGTFRNIAYLK